MRARLVPASFLFGVVLVTMSGGCGENVTQPVNDDPIVEAIDDATVLVGDKLVGRVVASDIQLEALTYTMTVVPVNAADHQVADAGIDPVTGDFWFVPSPHDVPGRTLRFTVTDAGGNATSTDQHVSVTYHVDQSNQWNLAEGSLANNVEVYAPMGQEFIPDSPVLDLVELLLYVDFPGTVRVRIRDGSVSGPVLAESESLNMARDDEYQTAVFLFERATLTPRHLYVLEVVPIDGAGILAVRGDDLYPRGRLIWSGVAQETADLWFREGALPRGPQGPPDRPRPHTEE